MCLWPSWLNTMQQWSDLRLIFVPKTKLTEPKIEQGTKNEIQMLMKWHAPVYRVKRYIVLCRHPLNLLSSLPDKHIPGAHVNVALIQMGLVSHPVKAEMSPDGWTLLWGAVDGVSSGLYGSSQAWLDPFHTEGPWRSLSITLRLLGYSWARTFTSVLLFLPSVKLVVQRAVFSETVILMAGLDWLIDWLIDCIFTHSNVRAEMVYCHQLCHSTIAAGALSTWISSTRWLQITFRLTYWIHLCMVWWPSAQFTSSL